MTIGASLMETADYIYIVGEWFLPAPPFVKYQNGCVGEMSIIIGFRSRDSTVKWALCLFVCVGFLFLSNP